MDTAENPQVVPNKVRFVHKKQDNYQSYYANGVFGAISGRGDFEFNFFYEHVNMPEEQVMINKEGQLKLDEEDTTEVLVIRDFKVGVVMTLEQSEAFSKWLVDAINEYKKKENKI